MENSSAYQTLMPEDTMEKVSGCPFVTCAWDGALEEETKEKA